MIFGYNIFYDTITYVATGRSKSDANRLIHKTRGFGRFSKVPPFATWIYSLDKQGMQIEFTYTDRTFI